MEEEHETKKSPHVLVFPFPAQGHINPMIQFCKRLVSKGVKITLVTTIYISKSIPSPDSHPTAIATEAVSDGFDDGGYASADSSESYLETFREVGSKSLANLINKLASKGKTIDALVYDGFLPWALDVSKAFGIDGGAFFTQACAVNNIYYHVHKGFQSLPLVPGSIVSVPGLPQLQYWETPSFVHNYGPYPGWSGIVFNQFSNIDQARWVFLNTFYKLEEEAIGWMRKLWRVREIGPTLPSMYLDRRLEDDKDYGINLFEPNHNECMSWLNDKPKGSVVYASFGSMAQLGAEQMEEVAWGLIDSDTNFLWVVKESEAEKLPREFKDMKTKKGLFVAWCRQLEVLAHESIGCFVTHCGFNSTLEAISLGVPMVAMPQWTDQTTNAKYLEDVWGVGLRVRPDEKGIVRRGNLVSCIKEIMEGERGLVARKNVLKWRDLAKEAVDAGGSSDKNIHEFAGELKHTC